MAETTFWWLATGIAVAVELLTGTFYLLMLAIGFAAAAIGAHLGLGLSAQIVVAAAVGSGTVVAWHVHRLRQPRRDAQANADVSLDIGETVQIDSWKADGTADVHYRGARWTAIHRSGIVPSPGAHRVAELLGNRLLVEKI